MKLGRYEIVDIISGRYVVVDIKQRIRDVYTKGDTEAAYAAYRAITGASVQESHKAVRPWLNEWEGKK
jgi:hypothetical protein